MTTTTTMMMMMTIYCTTQRVNDEC